MMELFADTARRYRSGVAIATAALLAATLWFGCTDNEPIVPDDPDAGPTDVDDPDAPASDAETGPDEPTDSCTDIDCPDRQDVTCVDGACVPVDDHCDNLECNQVSCPSDQGRTTLTGTVTIPSGDFPLPDVSVYIPNGELEPIPEGASCQQCDEMLTGDPLVQDVTDVEGDFELIDVPVADEVPLVVQTGKWRRQIEVSSIDPCADNEVDFQSDADIPLPSNQSEGDIPDIAVTTGGCDTLECLLYDIGLDDREFTTEDGDGAVNFYDADRGTFRYAAGFRDGQSFTDAEGWWDDPDNLTDYDILLHSCECSQVESTKPDEAHQALRDFTHQGGRVFMSHWQNVWLEHGTDEFQSVATWGATGSGMTSSAAVDTSHRDGQQMHQWMHHAGALDDDGHFDVDSPRYTIDGLNEELTERWLHYTDPDQTPLYFSFHTPVGADDANQCGRAVFSDLHVDDDHVGQPFPTGCGGSPSPQQKALMYMLFDLSACIAPDECTPLECEDVDDDCGTYDDGCGGTIDCGHCCLEEGASCSEDADCCSNSCAFSAGDDEGRCISP